MHLCIYRIYFHIFSDNLRISPKFPSSMCCFIKTTAEWSSLAGQLTSVQSKLSAAQPLYERADLNAAFYQPCWLKKKPKTIQNPKLLSVLWSCGRTKVMRLERVMWRHLLPWEEVAAAPQIQLLLCISWCMRCLCSVGGRPVRKASVFLYTATKLEVFLDLRSTFLFFCHHGPPGGLVGRLGQK